MFSELLVSWTPSVSESNVNIVISTSYLRIFGRLLDREVGFSKGRWDLSESSRGIR